MSTPFIFFEGVDEFDLEKPKTQQACSSAEVTSINPKSSDIITLLTKRYISTEMKSNNDSWVFHRCGTKILFRENEDIGAFFCDSKLTPIDGYDTFVESVSEIVFEELDTYGSETPYSVYQAECGNLDKDEMAFAAGCDKSILVKEFDTTHKKPKRLVSSFDNDSEMLESFTTGNKEYYCKGDLLCMNIFNLAEYEVYMINDAASSVFLIVRDNTVVDYFESSVGGEGVVIRLYKNDTIVAMSEKVCTVLYKNE